MKPKSKMIIATTLAILSLIIAAYPRCDLSDPNTDIQRDITPQSSHRAVTLPPLIEPQIPQTLPIEIKQSSTQNEPITEIDIEPPIEESLPTEIAPTQPTQKETADTTPTQDTQTDTKPTTPPTVEASTPKNGDVRIIDGKQQGYLLGFGWVDYMGENECIYCEGMYENSNKVGIMGGTTVGSNGDINKQVGIMD